MRNIYHYFKIGLNLKYLFLLSLFLMAAFANGQTNNPEINLKQGAVDKPSGSSYSFTNQNVNTNSNAVTFTIQNTGTANLTISDITLSGPDADQFTLTKTATSSIIAVGGTTTFTVNFSPKNNEPAAKSAVITILNDDADEGTYTLDITGTVVILKPTITSISTSGAVGATIIINGTNLINTTAVTFFNEVPATIVSTTNTQLRVVVPANAATGKIKVVNEAGFATSSQTFFITPKITGLSRTTGSIGSLLVITGTSFSGVTSVKFNGTEASFEINSNTQITVTVPEGATIGKITVTASGQVGTSTQTFTPPPTITSLSATSGIIGNTIIITGTNFTAAAIVKFSNNITATKTSVTPTEIKVTIPVGVSTGLGALTVTTIGGTVSADFTINNTTYTWNQASGNWSEPNNWTPARNFPTSNDILQFNGTTTANAVVTLDFTSPETIGYLSVINNAAITFTVAEDKILHIDNNVAAGADFIVTSGSSLTVTNSVKDADLIIDITSGETGSVAGMVTFQGTGTAEHRLLASTSGLTFATGGRFVAGLNLSGSPFGENTKSSVTFASGAFYYNRAGDSPFGAAGLDAVVVFSFGSTYSHEVNSAPDVVNRSYGHFIITNTPGATTAFNQTVAGVGDLLIRNDFTQTAPTNVPNPTFNLNLEGTITISGNLAVNKGTLSFNPASAATVSLAGNITFTNNSTLNFNNTSAITTVKLTGANKTISGTGILAVGANANLSVETGASVTLAKSITGTGSVMVNGTVRTANTSGLTGETASSFVNTLQSVKLNPTSTVEYTGTGAQNISAIDYGNLIISGARASKIITLPNLLRVSGLFSPVATNANYNTANTTIEFNGGEQTIRTFNYSNITISGTGNKTLAADVTINGNLSFSANKLITGNNKLILGSAATITGEAAGRYVVGLLETTRPVGSSGSNFGGMGITLSNGVNVGNVTVIRTSGPGSSVNINARQGINRTWNVQPTIQPATPIDVTLSWVADDDNSGIRGLERDLTTMRVWKTEGSDLSKYYDVSKADRNASSRTITATVFSFSILTVSDQYNPLPVELISFNVSKRDDQAVLTWQTATEKNNAGFAIELSADAKTFEEVGFVKSLHSNSSTVQSYTFTHRAGGVGTVYYRLKQTDWNGTTKYYGPKAIRFDQAATNLLVYPNPIKDKEAEVTVIITGIAKEKASVTVTDVFGRIVYRRTELINPTQNQMKVDLSRQPAGVYVINVTTPAGATQAKIVKH